MPLSKSRGNMYPWVTHTHTHLAGKCPHGCSYCYVQAMERRFQSGRYAGPVRLVEKEFSVQYGSGKTIFIEHCADLFAKGVPPGYAKRILAHCCTWPENQYVIQTRNTYRADAKRFLLPPDCLIGTTLETTSCAVSASVSVSPYPFHRLDGLVSLRRGGERTFLTVEPIMEMDVGLMLKWIQAAQPEFVNIGADSKGSGLKEPSAEEVRELIAGIKAMDIEIREKRNLDRILG